MPREISTKVCDFKFSVCSCSSPLHWELAQGRGANANSSAARPDWSFPQTQQYVGGSLSTQIPLQNTPQHVPAWGMNVVVVLSCLVAVHSLWLHFSSASISSVPTDRSQICSFPTPGSTGAASVRSFPLPVAGYGGLGWVAVSPLPVAGDSGSRCSPHVVMCHVEWHLGMWFSGDLAVNGWTH